MKRVIFTSLSFSLFLFLSCDKDITITKDAMNGVVQKGPFLNGSSVSIYELTKDFGATGRNYTTQILDNTGLFEIRNITLESPYVLLKADGYYFNEIAGANSEAPVTLYAMTDITDKTTVNVNVLSHLEKSRIEYLLSTGISFHDAKEMAESEVLNIFSIRKSDVSDFDLLDISKEGEDNAILLAVSLITQGFRTESEFSDLLANISTDIRQDGILNSQTLGSLLINDVRLLDLSKIRSNIEKRYNDLGMSVMIPDFETYVNVFIDSTTYTITNLIEYPEYSNYGKNVLYGEDTNFVSGSMAANLPKGASLKIIIKGGLWWYNAMPNGPVNWTITNYDFAAEEQIFTATESGKSCDLVIGFETGMHTIEYYENNAATPTRIKVIHSE
jgi:hypothetical protein